MSGYYTIQLWGGDGGVGSDTTFNDGGKGGKGGYVYTAVKLEKGDILAYRLGGNGTQTLKTEDGGGVNGDGGGHGKYGSYYIGGGGGYSIVYLYKNGAAANKFVKILLQMVKLILLQVLTRQITKKSVWMLLSTSSLPVVAAAVAPEIDLTLSK